MIIQDTKLLLICFFVLNKKLSKILQFTILLLMIVCKIPTLTTLRIIIHGNQLFSMSICFIPTKSKIKSQPSGFSNIPSVQLSAKCKM